MKSLWFCSAGDEESDVINKRPEPPRRNLCFTGTIGAVIKKKPASEDPMSVNVSLASAHRTCGPAGTKAASHTGSQTGWYTSHPGDAG